MAIIHQPKYFSKSTFWFYKLYQKKFFQTANQIITLSQFVKQGIITHYQIPSEKIAVLPPAANTKFAPILFEERQALKNTYAEGKEYFLFVGGTATQNNLMNVLKAFSIFKKWQQSNMMLLVVGRCDSGFMEKLKTYKYRNEVAMLGYLPQENYSSILAACYALVYISFYEGHCLPLLEAMQTGAASIASSSSPLPEIVADAALYANPIDVEEIANQMKKMYRDENLRSQLINEGLIEAAKFSWDAAAEKFMKIVMAASSK